MVRFFELWSEHQLRLLGASLRAGSTTKGSVHVYDCRDVSWTTIIADARYHWTTISRMLGGVLHCCSRIGYERV